MRVSSFLHQKDSLTGRGFSEKNRINVHDASLNVTKDTFTSISSMKVIKIESQNVAVGNAIEPVS